MKNYVKERVVLAIRDLASLPCMLDEKAICEIKAEINLMGISEELLETLASALDEAHKND